MAGDSASSSRALRGLVLYYLGTPAFILLDVFMDASVRVALPGGWPRGLYYGGLLGLALLCRARPSLAPWVGMGESATSLLLLILGVLLPVWNAPGRILAGGAGPDPSFLLERVANLALAGTALVASFHAGAAEVSARKRTIP